MFGKKKLCFEGLESRWLMTVPDFSLLDVNPTSERSGQMVSPTDYVGSVSGWYFGHST
jgi:hypothetical protein